MSLATRIGEEFNLVRDEGVARLNALAPYNGIIGTDTKQQQENLVFSTTVGNEYKLADTSRFRKIDGKVIDTYGPDLSNNSVNTLSTGVSAEVVLEVLDNFLVENKIYYATFYISNYISGNFQGYSGGAMVGDGTTISSNGVHTLRVTGNDATKNLSIYSIGFKGTIKVVGIREVQTIDFSRSGQHPFEVYTNTALTAPNAVLAGDYVVVDTPNKNTDFNFVNAIGTTWKQTEDGWSLLDGKAICDGVDSLEYFYFQSITYSGFKAIISFEVVDYVSGSLYLSVSDGNITSQLISSNGKYSIIQTFISPTLYFRAQNFNGAIKGVSVKLLEDTYRAKIDAPVSTALTNTTYFETRNYISNQVLAMQKADGTIHTETLFEDAYAVETTNEVLTKNGWSKVENGLYSKGTVVGTPVGYWQTLNKGAYHPVFNSMGNSYFGEVGDTTRTWYSSIGINQAANGLYGIVSLDLYNKTASARPDSKFYNIIYSNQFRDLRTNAEKANIPQLLNEVHNGAVNGSLGGYSDTVGFTKIDKGTRNALYRNTESTTTVYMKDGLSEYYTVGDYFKGTINSTNGVVLLEGKIISKAGAPYYFIIIKQDVALGLDAYSLTTVYSDGEWLEYKTLPITSYKAKLETRLYGDPQFYPQTIKDKLASGKPILLNPMLIDESGTSLIPTGQTTFQLSGSKAITMLSSIKSTDSDTAPTAPTWASTVPTLDSINNKFTQTLATGDIAIVNVTSSNPVANISTPKAVQQVGNYTVATNSHSIYKGNNLTQLIGKVAVGNGVKGVVSKVVEDVRVVSKTNIYLASSGTSPYGLETGNVFFDDTTLYNTQKYYSYNGSTVSSTFNFSSFNFNTAGWVETSICGFPNHSTIDLDNSNSPAIKTLSTIATADDGELLYQVFGEEGKLNTTWGFDTDFSQLTNGTLVDLNGATVRTIVATTGLGVYK